LKVNYPALNIFNEACDSNSFRINDKGKLSIKTDGLKITGTSTEMPSEVTYSSGLTLTYKGSLTGIENGYLAVDSNGNVTPEEMKTMRISASVGDGLSINGIANGSIVLTDSAPDFTIELVKDESGSLSSGANPWGLTFEGSYIYSGVAAYATGGILASLNKYEDSYVTTKDTDANNDFTNVVTNLWDSTNNDAINLLKNPYPIQAHTGSVKGRFIINPCIANLGSNNTGTTITPSAEYSTSGEVETLEEKIEVEDADGNKSTVTVTSTTTSYIHSLEGFTNEGKLTAAGKYRIPKHASSVILEIHHLSDILVQSASNYNSFNSLSNGRDNLADNIVSATTNKVSLPSITSTTNKVLLRALGSGIDTVEVPLITIKQDEFKIVGEDTSSVTYAKFFQYGINTSGNVLINVIGYRV
jgi:hypothetical protein